VKSDGFRALGAEVAASPAELMARVDVACLCLTDGTAVESVVFGEQGLLNRPASVGAKFIVDFSSIDPQLTIELAQRARQAGCDWIDAPVSGGVPGAEAGKLIVFAGGEASAIAMLQPIFSAVATKVTHMGANGAGQTTKVCNQMIVSCSMLLLAETFAAARRVGVDTTRLAGALAGGFADSLPLQIFGPRMAEHRFEPRLGAIHLMAKDLSLAQKMVRAGDSFAPISQVCAELYRSVRQHPGVTPDEDLSALIKLFERT
jgi:3-hydroxyisobutyrate dehydrogenase